MKILIAKPDRAFCLHIPLMMVCNRVGAALLAGGLRHARRLPDGSAAVGETSLVTTGQVHAMLKSLRESQKTLKRLGLPLVDIEEKDGSRLVITL